MSDDSYCGECGQPLVPIHGTATIACCSARYYWYGQGPGPRDNLAPLETCVVKGRRFWRYEWRPKLFPDRDD